MPPARRDIVQQRFVAEQAEFDKIRTNSAPTGIFLQTVFSSFSHHICFLIADWLFFSLALHSDELQGRQSGSEAWRAERGEIGQNPKSEFCAVPTASLKKPLTPSPPSLHTHEVIKMDSTNVNNNLHLDRFVILLFIILSVYLRSFIQGLQQ